MIWNSQTHEHRKQPFQKPSNTVVLDDQNIDTEADDALYYNKRMMILCVCDKVTKCFYYREVGIHKCKESVFTIFPLIGAPGCLKRDAQGACVNGMELQQKSRCLKPDFGVPNFCFKYENYWGEGYKLGTV